MLNKSVIVSDIKFNKVSYCTLMTSKIIVEGSLGVEKSAGEIKKYQ